MVLLVTVQCVVLANMAADLSLCCAKSSTYLRDIVTNIALKTMLYVGYTNLKIAT